jgi:hypothetical protein
VYACQVIQQLECRACSQVGQLCIIAMAVTAELPKAQNQTCLS